MSKIFIVEDSKIVTLHLQKTLESSGYEVVGAESSGEALLKKLKDVKPDLILMDIMVNGVLDGIETAMKVKENYSIPVIYITALTDPDTIKRAKITEPYGYLTKPFEDRDIFAVVEMALYKHATEVRLRKTEERFYNTLNSISDAVITIDTDFKITYMNPTALLLTGSYQTSAIGKELMEVMQLEETVSGIFPFNPLHCLIDNGNSNRLIDGLVLRTKSSQTPIGAGSIAPISNEKGELTGIVINFKDLTETTLREQMERSMEKKRLAAIIEGQEQERGRISRELHDGLGQMLNAVKMKLEVNSEVSNLIDSALIEIAKISENLMPYKLKDFQLHDCIGSLCEQFSSNEAVQVNFSFFGDADLNKGQQKINFYRIAQEGLTNAMKHAQASTVSVQLNNDQEKIQLIIEDDGVGFSTNNLKDSDSHHGLINIRQRAESMGGSFIIESDSKRGTLLIIEAPI